MPVLPRSGRKPQRVRAGGGRSPFGEGFRSCREVQHGRAALFVEVRASPDRLAGRDGERPGSPGPSLRPGASSGSACGRSSPARCDYGPAPPDPCADSRHSTGCRTQRQPRHHTTAGRGHAASGKGGSRAGGSFTACPVGSCGPTGSRGRAATTRARAVVPAQGSRVAVSTCRRGAGQGRGGSNRSPATRRPAARAVSGSCSGQVSGRRLFPPPTPAGSHFAWDRSSGDRSGGEEVRCLP